MSKVIELLNEALRLLGQEIQPPSDTDANPLTAKLGPRGEWVPPALTECVAKVLNTYPDGYKRTQVQGPNGIETQTVRLTWPVVLVYSGCLSRQDLTEAQRAAIEFAHNHAWPLAMASSGYARERLVSTSLDWIKGGPISVAVFGPLYAIEQDRTPVDGPTQGEYIARAIRGEFAFQFPEVFT